jgi:hypothetical protein
MPNRLSWWRLPSISIAEPVSRSLRVHSREWNFFRRMSSRNLSLSACDPRKWAPNVWHHIQIGMHRDANGVVAHDWVNFDGTHHAWGYSRQSAHFLGWEPAVVNVQYQIEESSTGSGPVTSYMHKLTICRC